MAKKTAQAPGEMAMSDSMYLHVTKSDPIKEANKFIKKVRKKDPEANDKVSDILTGDEFDDSWRIIHTGGFADSTESGKIVEIPYGPYTETLQGAIIAYLIENPDSKISLLTKAQVEQILIGNGG